MVGPQKALNIVLSYAPSPQEENIGSDSACGRVLARDIIASADYPEFDRATMDGFAFALPGGSSVRSLELSCIGEIFAGQVWKKKLKKGFCAAISTGSAIPVGADCVVKKEDAKILPGGARIAVLKYLSRWENVARRGQDFKQGSVLLKKGLELNMSRVALLASQGMREVNVFKSPKVALLSTGDEVVEPGERKKYGRVWNSSGMMLSCALKSIGTPYSYLGIARDSESHLIEKIKKGLKNDILIVTGAVSAGKRDFVPRVLERCGVSVKLRKVALRPGKPLLFGVKGRSIIFGLPGNPVSSMVSFLFFVMPLIRKMTGLKTGIAYENGILSCSARNESDRMSFFPACIENSGSGIVVKPVRYSGSADIWAVSKADAFFVLDKYQRLKRGAEMRFVRIVL